VASKTWCDKSSDSIEQEADLEMKRTVVTMPGDGIGKTVLPESIRVLDAVGFEADYVHADIGWDFWINEGNPLPDRTIELLKQHKLGLFGAITSKPKDKAAAEIKTELRDKGFVYFSPIVGMRQLFNLDICVRPCRSLFARRPAADSKSPTWTR
jgi:isocitrate dehydrogenase (NAD+)